MFLSIRLKVYCKIRSIFRVFIIVAFVCVYSQGYTQKLVWQTVLPQTESSFRALSVVDDHTAWVAGTKGWVGISNDGGISWTFSQVAGFETSDFRSLYAFSSQKAVIANAGAPANILITEDGGKNWNVVYTNNDTASFIDGVDFWNDREGLVYGDPINGRMLLVKTIDGGKSWSMLTDKERPLLSPGEASFAASGTNIRCAGRSLVVIGTGGKSSRLWVSENKGSSWKVFSPPVIQGQSSTGIFSFSGFNKNSGVIVGGDYLKDTLAVDHVFYTLNNGKTWNSPVTPTRGYRECVEYLSDNFLIATGPRGTDISVDGGKTWVAESDEPYFHVVRKARKGNLIIIAGGRGKISVLKMP
jgi:photosystem II stability/assembly factor-like uncharacterized protein